MNKRGFTLVELLAVIVILAIIATITTLSVSNIISKSENTLSEAQKQNIEKAVENYYIKENISENNFCINIKTLIDEGYIDGKEIKDPKDKETMLGSVKVTYENNRFKYTYQDSNCIDENVE